MKITDLEQSLKCSKCKSLHVLRTCRRVLNFTSGEVTFYCRCRSRLMTLPFSRWNALQRAYHENPPPSGERQQQQGPREGPREGRRRRRDRFRNRGRPGQNPSPRSSSNRS